jgi:hypothetical protein
MEGGAPRSSPDLRCGGGDRRGARGGGDGTGPRAGGAARGGVAVMGLSRDGGGGSGGWGAVADRRIGAGSGEVGTNPDFFGGGAKRAERGLKNEDAVRGAEGARVTKSQGRLGYGIVIPYSGYGI